jgi:hypothetical protein
MKRFYPFLSDMLSLGIHATQSEEAGNDWQGKPEVYTVHGFADEKLWINFTTKWNLPALCDYSWMLEQTRMMANLPLSLH